MFCYEEVFGVKYQNIKSAKKYDTFYGVVIKIGFQVNRRQRGTIKKKG